MFVKLINEREIEYSPSSSKLSSGEYISNLNSFLNKNIEIRKRDGWKNLIETQYPLSEGGYYLPFYSEDEDNVYLEWKLYE